VAIAYPMALLKIYQKNDKSPNTPQITQHPCQGSNGGPIVEFPDFLGNPFVSERNLLGAEYYLLLSCYPFFYAILASYGTS